LRVSEINRDRGLGFQKKIRDKGPAANKMFAQWCVDVLPKVFIFVPRFGAGDRTQLRNRTTAQTQTLAASIYTQR